MTLPLADTDHLALSRRFLLAHQPLVALLGQGQVIAGVNEPPYPRIRLTDPPGDDRGLEHLIAPLLQVEVYGDPDGSTPKALLRRILYTALEALRTLPERQATGAFAYVGRDPVVTEVTSAGGGGYVPEPTGQPRYLATVRMYVHPRRHDQS